MTHDDVLIGELLDETSLSLVELAQACHVEEQWVLERAEAGIIQGDYQAEVWHFFSEDLIRARKLITIERSFDTDAELAALVADLIDEIHQLKKQLKVT